MTTSSAGHERLPEQVHTALTEAGVRPGERLIVAVSGGVDSVVLFNILHGLSTALDLSLHVAHLDHGLRPDAAADAEFVSAMGRDLGWQVTVETADVAAVAQARGLSIEHAGRDCRREFWRRVQERTQARWIVLGHHADDQAETVLLRLLRGSGITGLGGMRAVTDNILRPLLAARRADIEAYARRHELPVREDPSNRDMAFARNRLRHELLPQLRQRHNPAVVDALNRTATLAQADDDYLHARSIEAAAGLLKRRSATCVTLDAMALRGYHMAVQRRVLRQYIQEFAQHRHRGQATPSLFAVVQELMRRVQTHASGMYQASGDIWAESTPTDLILRCGFPPAVQLPLSVPGMTDWPDRPGSVRAKLVSQQAFAQLRGKLSARSAAFDANAVCTADGAGLMLRSPRSGDRLRPFGMQGRHKKLSDCFIDAKWPRILRADVLLLTCTAAGAEEVLWVPGLVRSDAFRVTSKTDSILHLEFVDTTLQG